MKPFKKKTKLESLKVNHTSFNNLLANMERISGKAGYTLTNWIMLNHITDRIESTCPNTRIFTFFVDACKGCGTFGVNGALGSAIWCMSNIVWEAGTCSRATNNTTL